MTLELYNFAQSTCSLKVRLALHQKGIEWVDRRLVSKTHDHLSDWYLKLNPNGVVPTLIHDGRPIYESSTILQYLEEIHPEPSLMPTDPYLRAKLRAFLTYVDLVTTPASRYPSFQYGGLRIKFREMSEEKFREMMNRRPVKSAFYKRMDKDEGFPDDLLSEAFKDLRASAARMDLYFEENGGPWLMGEQLTIADFAIAPLIDRLEDIGLEYLWEERHPRVADWFERLKALPAYEATYYEGSRLSDQYPELNLGRGANRDVLLDRFPAAA